MYDDLNGRTALITGSGKRSGIGFAIARKLAGCHCNVIIADLGEETDDSQGVRPATNDEMQSIADELHEAHGVHALAVAVDVSSNNSISGMMETVASRFESVEILVNNAGGSWGVPNTIDAFDEDAWMKTFDVNLHSVFRVSRCVLPMMKKDNPSIINMASKAGKAPLILNGAYAVTKAGVIMLTKAMAKELAGQGIRVNAICPGLIMTDLQAWRLNLEAEVFHSSYEERERELCKQVPLGYLGSPDDVANMAAFLASCESSYVTGQAINVCGGQIMEL